MKKVKIMKKFLTKLFKEEPRKLDERMEITLHAKKGGYGNKGDSLRLFSSTSSTDLDELIKRIEELENKVNSKISVNKTKTKLKKRN